MGRTIRTRDGLALVRRDWPSADARGTIVIVHGLGEHIGRYAHVAARLNARGWSVVGYDQRGHGASPGARGRLAADDDLLADLARGHRRACAPRRAGPLVLLGHSLGGLVAARFVAGALESPRPAWQRDVDALVLSSPALDIGMTARQARPAGDARAAGAEPRRSATASSRDRISRDAAVVAAYRADPLVHDRDRAAPGRASSPTPAGACARWRRAGACRRCCSMPAATAASCRPAAPRSPPRRRRRS